MDLSQLHQSSKRNALFNSSVQMSSCLLLVTEQQPENGFLPVCSPNVTLPKVMLAQGSASNKSTFVNVRHRITQMDARQRGAVLKGALPNVSDRLTQSDARQRGASKKGRLSNVSHRLTQMDARQRGACVTDSPKWMPARDLPFARAYFSMCVWQTHPTWSLQETCIQKRQTPQCESQTQWLRVKLGYCSLGKLARKS